MKFLTSGLIFVSGLVFFYVLQRVGGLLMERNNRIEVEVLGGKEKDGDDVENRGAALATASSAIAESKPGCATTGCG